MVWEALALIEDQPAAHALHSASRGFRRLTSGFITRRIMESRIMESRIIEPMIAAGQFVSTWPREAELNTLEVPMRPASH